jgi:SAM-dependent methyltransferase
VDGEHTRRDLWTERSGHSVGVGHADGLGNVVSAIVEQANEGRRETVRYHEDFYAHHELFVPGSWLHRPAPFVLRALERYDEDRPLVALDLGCGVGRHTIPVAQRLPVGSHVIGIDLIPLAVRRLCENARAAGVGSAVQGVVGDLEHTSLAARSIDWLVSVSALEHVSGPEAFEGVLRRLRDATRPGGLNCLIIGTDKVEIDSLGRVRPARVEFHLATAVAQDLLRRSYDSWDIVEASAASFSVEEDRDGERYTLRTTNLRLLARKPTP